MTIGVVTDSTVNLPPGVAEKLDIKIVPLYVTINGEQCRDGTELNSDEFFDRLPHCAELPITSQPSQGDFMKAFQQIGEKADEIISIHLPSKVSGTYNSARLAADSFREKKIKVVDFPFLSFGLGFAVIKAAEMAKKGESIDAIIAKVEELKLKPRLYGILDTLHYLKEGGRIGRVSALLGSLLKIKPIIKMEGGELVPVSRPRSRKKGVTEMIERFLAEGKMEKIEVIHAAEEAEAVIVRERLKGHYPNLEIHVAQIGPVLGVHSGPGLVGICGLLK